MTNMTRRGFLGSVLAGATFAAGLTATTKKAEAACGFDTGDKIKQAELDAFLRENGRKYNARGENSHVRNGRRLASDLREKFKVRVRLTGCAKNGEVTGDIVARGGGTVNPNSNQRRPYRDIERGYGR